MIINKLKYINTKGSIFFGMNNILFIIFIFLSLVGVAMLYSVGGGIHPWALKHFIRTLICIGIIIFIARIKIVFWFEYAYHIYILNCAVLMYMSLMQEGISDVNRWFNIGFMSIQPSEFAKITTIIALAKVLHQNINRIQILTILQFLSILMLPVYLIFSQPDLGTSALVFIACMSLFVSSYIHHMYHIAGICTALISIPIIWTNLKDYQKARIFSYINGEESDYRGDGYHLIQSKIAIGSGGLFGKGYMQGTQNQFGFLPVKMSDFIFTVICEELGSIFAIFIILVYWSYIFIGCYFSYIYSNKIFSSMLIIGLSSNIFLYVFINIGMISGILPIVGVPIPLISYGGSAMISMAFTTGVLMGIHSQVGLKKI